MTRRNKEPCEYCEQDWTTIPSIEEDDRLTLELYPGHIISASAILYNKGTEETFEACAEIPMNFCPACGRDLRI